MLDTFEAYRVDSQWLGRNLEALPGSYHGPTNPLPAPYAVTGFGEGAWPADFARGLLTQSGPQRPVSQQGGTQFVLLGGLDLGEADTASLFVTSGGALPYRIGHRVWHSIKLGQPLHERLDDQGIDEAGFDDQGELEHTIAASPLSAYHYLQALAYATDNGERAEAAEMLLADLRDRCATSVASEDNPAKGLAWSLWTRTPLLLASREHAAQVWTWQRHLARIAKSLSIALEHDALTVLAGGFEARHESGDRLVALLLGGKDRTLTLAHEILQSRVDDVIVVKAESQDTYAAGLGLWYLGAWVAYYLAMMYKTDPKDSSVLEKLQAL
jgi:type IV secretory pathway TrbD component